uniref:(northern house mosquito) hypothetical protein n=1 Tax=Culex pipiens TaxID=7175 RepID=A0A8D8PAT8_CULPI
MAANCHLPASSALHPPPLGVPKRFGNGNRQRAGRNPTENDRPHAGAVFERGDGRGTAHHPAALDDGRHRCELPVHRRRVLDRGRHDRGADSVPVGHQSGSVSPARRLEGRHRRFAAQGKPLDPQLPRAPEQGRVLCQDAGQYPLLGAKLVY